MAGISGRILVLSLLLVVSRVGSSPADVRAGHADVDWPPECWLSSRVGERKTAVNQDEVGSAQGRVIQDRIQQNWTGIAIVNQPPACPNMDVDRKSHPAAFEPEKVLFGTDSYSETNTVGREEIGWMTTKSNREALALALTEMMADGEINRERATELATMVCGETPWSFINRCCHRYPRRRPDQQRPL